jgi:hypothetical protein
MTRLGVSPGIDVDHAWVEVVQPCSECHQTGRAANDKDACPACFGTRITRRKVGLWELAGLLASLHVRHEYEKRQPDHDHLLEGRGQE